MLDLQRYSLLTVIPFKATGTTTLNPNTIAPSLLVLDRCRLSILLEVDHMKIATTPMSAPLGTSPFAARDAIDRTIGTWPPVINFGLLAFEHRHESDCIDIERGISPAPLDHPTLVPAINAINSRSQTPQTSQTTLYGAMIQTAETLPFRRRLN